MFALHESAWIELLFMAAFASMAVTAAEMLSVPAFREDPNDKRIAIFIIVGSSIGLVPAAVFALTDDERLAATVSVALLTALTARLVSSLARDAG